ncbi:MAG: aminomethyl-transferring glycine dehydrogenase subunit GcvPB [Halobacteriovoraceae bacterium]|nr:aminomethyl-transferring glycine dehydrogenase subunit GcvPB [Halobacteriovoraceae bacterium]
MTKSSLPYNPQELKRELAQNFIIASKEEKRLMLEEIKLTSYEQLYKHIDDNIIFSKTPHITDKIEYNDLVKHMEDLSRKNNIKASFLGHGLQQYKVPEIVPFVCSLRGLTTAYTPYQPERSQGTLNSLWIYSSVLSKLTGFEAINASLYDRSTCLFEAIQTANRLKKSGNKALVFESIYKSDIEVLMTQAIETDTTIELIPFDRKKGKVDIESLKKKIENKENEYSCICFPQVNAMGILEDIHEITDLCFEKSIKSVAIFDPMLLGQSGLIPPSEFGTSAQGADIIVGEGQHLCLGPNFGGPGLGIFGIRYNEKDKISIRSTAGRYVGRAVDRDGKECLAMVLSTREQHIRREKATSNICSNQSFVATIAGAALLQRGDEGMSQAHLLGRKRAVDFAQLISGLTEVELLYPTSTFYNEVAIKFKNIQANDLIKKASLEDLHIGVNLTNQVGDENAILVSFSDWQSDEDVEKLHDFILSCGGKHNQAEPILEIPTNLLRKSKVGLRKYGPEELKNYYQQLSHLNVSPDDSIYPLGSCTMKYNPYINDYAASLSGFTDIHPDVPEEDAQGCLHILYETQEMFKSMTGLAAVVTQPVAGAQGELVGIKMFQAYHRDKGEIRDLILIPRSAHGTNPATATMAGLISKKTKDSISGILTVEADENGLMNIDQINNYVQEYGKRIMGIMVTNPNTSGVFETSFKQMAGILHSIDALVYMDGANMNAIAGWVNLAEMGVDAVHNNLHKTWTIPHGGGGPGDAIVAVSEKLVDYIPGIQVAKENDKFSVYKAPKSIGSFHRHMGNFAHKIRAYTYLKALGSEGIKEMSAFAVLSARYLHSKIKGSFITLPSDCGNNPRMHEFIITLSDQEFKKMAEAGTPKTLAIARVGKLFLDFGLHAPTVAFPEAFGLMIEPTESFSKAELDHFVDIVLAIKSLINEAPEILQSVPHFTPVSKVDEVAANKDLILRGQIDELPRLWPERYDKNELLKMNVHKIVELILTTSKVEKKK